MKTFPHAFITFPAFSVLIAGFFLTIAWKTLVAKRPLVISGRWLFGLIVVGWSPSIILTVISASNGNHDLLYARLVPNLMFLALIVICWIQTKGYSVFAITDTYLRETLLAAAAALGYTVEETMSCLRIKETGQEIQISIQGWMGTAQIRPKGRASASVVNKIVVEMRRHFQTPGPGQTKYLISWFYLIIGLLMLFCGGTFAVIALSHHP